MKRVLTALALIPVFAYLVLGAPQWLFAAVLTAVAGLCFYEYAGLVAAHGINPPGPAGYAAGLALLWTPAGPGFLAAVLAAVLSLTMATRSTELSRALPHAGAFVLGVLYVFGAWRCAVELRAMSVHWLMFALALNWVGDIGAYYVGKRIGRHKLAPRISPAKSWEGAAASLAASLAFGGLYLGRFVPEVPVAAVLGITSAANIAGQVGDLAESALKRGAGLKDSSGLLPGHGGWLDRTDSSLFALPVVLAAVAVFSRFWTSGV